ncbi:hypothetical protein BcDW1_2315 [Botrytis cinerea BcDW1]|uniref:Uncharacterized protein n=1 Tax=Botryotinia fuckeliana (strain BcDW1) TaxID=1290391 RepID=M7U5U7_BOTF1|nr:hypothetical protein BcDW1_2315 [Botrytis cinerea BcDW1]
MDLFSKDKNRYPKDKNRHSKDKNGHSKAKESREKSADRRERQSIAASKARDWDIYLRKHVGKSAPMPGLAEDIGVLLQTAITKLKELQAIDKLRFGGSKAGGFFKECAEHLEASQKIQQKMDKHIRNEQKDLKIGDLAESEKNTESTAGINAYNAAFEHDKNCSPQVWETKRRMQKIEGLLNLISDQYKGIIESESCSVSKYGKDVLRTTKSDLEKFKKTTHGFALLALVPNNTTL